MWEADSLMSFLDFMDPSTWEVLFIDLAIPVTPQGGCVCYTSILDY